MLQCPMRIESIDLNPILEIASYTAGRGGRSVEYRRLPILKGTISGLPEGLAGIVATSDLQGYHAKHVPVAERQLSGLCMASALRDLADAGDIPALGSMGLCLPGDYYAIATLDKRGGMGNVEHIWREFSHDFRWVAGVAGNHDSFADTGSFAGIFDDLPHVHGLEADSIKVDNFTLAGLSGIEGNKRKFWHYPIDELSKRLKNVLAADPELLVMHDGPASPSEAAHCQCWYTDAMRHYQGLVIRGHRYWEQPVQDIKDFQVLNVDSRAVVLEAI